MSELLQKLRQFNRKERFYLVSWALGGEGFGLSSSFRSAVGRAIGVAVPEAAFTAMDYHLDWLYASLVLSADDAPREPHCNHQRFIEAQQEDIDLVVAFQAGGTSHIVLGDAKGATPFSNSQLYSKATRLGRIFGDTGERYPGVAPSFVITSPRESREIVTDGWPGWMTPNGRPIWIELPMPSNLHKVTRCTANGVVSSKGDHWRVIPDRGAFRRAVEPCSSPHDGE
jgi:hypothetical protein